MKLILDENVPKGLSLALPGHECTHVIERGWAGIKNGVLLELAQKDGFDVLITSDAEVPHQNKGRFDQIALIILRPQGQGPAAVRALAPFIIETLNGIQPGSVVVVSNR